MLMSESAGLGDRPDTLEVVVAERVHAAERIVALTVRTADGVHLPAFTAGAHVDVHVGPCITRQYSLCSDPADLRSYRLAVLRETQSRGGSAGVYDGFPVGHRFAISPPRNNFPLIETAQRSILIAGGVGVTPIVAMAYRLEAIHADFALHYCARTRGSAAFADELATASFGRNVVLHLDDGPDAQRFRVDALRPDPDLETHVYVCGPQGFLDHVTERLRRGGWPDPCVHIERFSADLDRTGATFTVVAALSGRRFVVPSGASIAETLRKNGVHVEVSCEQGVCGTCLTRVLSGIPEHRDLYQTDAEKAANTYMTPCCSRSKTAELVLEI
jgi:vanillate O-demethylase ferredoxin subunit